jgi:hypothetical protein
MKVKIIPAGVWFIVLSSLFLMGPQPTGEPSGGKRGNLERMDTLRPKISQNKEILKLDPQTSAQLYMMSNFPTKNPTKKFVEAREKSLEIEKRLAQKEISKEEAANEIDEIWQEIGHYYVRLNLIIKPEQAKDADVNWKPPAWTESWYSYSKSNNLVGRGNTMLKIEKNGWYTYMEIITTLTDPTTHEVTLRRLESSGPIGPTNIDERFVIILPP